MTREEKKEELIGLFSTGTMYISEVIDECFDFALPKWISVEDEMPPRWETNPNVSVLVITCKFVNRELQDIDLQRYVFGESKWQYGDATHWMHFQFPEKGGEQ